MGMFNDLSDSFKKALLIFGSLALMVIVAFLIGWLSSISNLQGFNDALILIGVLFIAIVFVTVSLYLKKR